MKVSIRVHKNISVPRFTFNGAFLAIAVVLRQFTTAENDYNIRELMGELTAEEARAVVLADFTNAEWHRLAEKFWMGGAS